VRVGEIYTKSFQLITVYHPKPAWWIQKRKTDIIKQSIKDNKTRRNQSGKAVVSLWTR